MTAPIGRNDEESEGGTRGGGEGRVIVLEAIVTRVEREVPVSTEAATAERQMRKRARWMATLLQGGGGGF